MVTRQNLHTHTLFCDGKNTMEEMVQAALDAGLASLGFSSHNHTGFPFDACGIRADRIDAYFAEIGRLREKYGERITLYSGFEIESRAADRDAPYFDPRLDYAIGSVHFFRVGGSYYAVDNTPAEFRSAIEAAGSARDLLEGYFAEVLRYAQSAPYDILGHYDLVTKFAEKDAPFDAGASWYKDLALSFLESAAATGKIFEINTGAIARGWRTAPYPALFLLKRLSELHAPVIIESDCHSAEGIVCHFAETEELLRSTGFTEQMALTENGFAPVPL